MLLRILLLTLNLCLSVQAQDFNLRLPGGSTLKVALNKRHDEDLTLYYEGEFLQEEESRFLMMRLRGDLKSAYQNYRTLFSTGQLAGCLQPPKVQPALSYVFLHSFPADGHDRIGYDHRDNPGLLVQTTDWLESEVRRMVIHEALHRWCAGSSQRTASEHWKEEGAADYLTMMALGTPTQLNITRYFDTLCGATLRGGSTLWWMAYMEARKSQKSFLDELAKFHLGLRADLIHGRLEHFGDARCRKAIQVYPYGILVPYEKTKPENAVPYWDMPWGVTEIQSTARAELIESVQPTGYFIWVNPVSK